MHRVASHHKEPQSDTDACCQLNREHHPAVILCVLLLGTSNRWAVEQGAASQLTPALFSAGTPTTSSSNGSRATDSTAGGSSTSVSPGLRGCAAAADLPAGSVVMEVPLQLLITYRTAAESDFGRALSKLPGERQ